MMDAAELKHRSDLAFGLAARRLKSWVTTHPDRMPSFTVGGRWQKQVPGWTNWCEGFTGGQLWLVYRWTGEAWFRAQAERCTRRVEPRKDDRSVHDLGFIFLPTWKAWYDLIGDPQAQQVLIHAGKTLAERFQEPGGYLCSFEGAYSLYIDIMMNVGLVFYAAAAAGDERLQVVACRHCLTTRRRLVRGDGSTAHEGIFDPATGEFLRQNTRQGWRSDSTWARGLTWALCGFCDAFTFTGDRRFLETAGLIAGYYLERTPPGAVPPNDWDAPHAPCESSAAAVACCGLLKLSRLTADPDRATAYRRAALDTLATLTSPQYLALEDDGWEGVLKHGIYHLPGSVGVDESVIWGDYYLLEALFLAAE